MIARNGRSGSARRHRSRGGFRCGQGLSVRENHGVRPISWRKSRCRSGSPCGDARPRPDAHRGGLGRPFRSTTGRRTRASPGWRIAPGTNRRRAFRDGCNRAAIAVRAASAVTTLPLSAIRQSTSIAASSSPPWSAATVASVRRNRAAEGRDHHPGPSALLRPSLALVARTAQGLAVDAITSPSPRSAAIAASTRPNAASSALGSIIRNTVRIGVMRWDRMPELQEASENMLFFPTEVRDPGATGRPAEQSNKGRDAHYQPGDRAPRQRQKERCPCGERAPEGCFMPANPSPENRKTPHINSDPKRNAPRLTLS